MQLLNSCSVLFLMDRMINLVNIDVGIADDLKICCWFLFNCESCLLILS